MTLRTKILSSQIVLAVAPLLIIAGAVLWQADRGFRKASSQAQAGLETNMDSGRAALTASASNDLTHIARNVAAMCEAQQEVLQQKVNADLNVAREVLKQAGPVSFAKDTVRWQATNQYSKQKDMIELPKMLVGGTWLGQNKDAQAVSPIVDRLKELVGGTCTIFQRMNAAGDMLRVCTNVQSLDGARAIGTFIPATDPAGGPNPVIENAIKGQAFHGRAYVVNAWYVTAYEPIKDASGDVVGMLYVGVKEESAQSLRRAIMATQVGKSGYVYVLNTKGDTRGHYIISKDGKRDGENLWESKDADGRPIIQDICKTAAALRPDQVGELRYGWKNPGDTEARYKVVKIAYFEPWDWAIGVSAYEDDFFGAIHEMDTKAKETLAGLGASQSEAIRSVILWCVGVAGTTIVLTIVVALLVTRGITRPLHRIITGMNEGACQVNSAAEQVASAAQQLAEGTSEQAAAIEQSSAALEELAAVSRHNADNAGQANTLATGAKDVLGEADTTVAAASEAIHHIAEASGKIGNIIKVIEEIAFQTNLLALNAAVEAARAGEHGKGFAVVADEVRSLAQRAAGAAKETNALIEQTVQRICRGAEMNKATTACFARIAESVNKVSTIVAGIAEASHQQATSVDQTNSAVGQMDKVTQQNAAGAEESAAAAEELSAQAATVRGMVDELIKLVGGTSSAATESHAKSARPPGA